MRTLYLLRHGKSLWNAGAASDFERTLNNRGRSQAEKIGRYLVESGAKIDLILCSPATRTRQTLEIVKDHLEHDVRVRFEPSLYGAMYEEVIDKIQETPLDIESLLIVGHNPWIQQVSFTLSGDGEMREQIATKFPTCSLCRIEFQIDDWQVSRHNWINTHLQLPSDIEFN